MKGLCPSGTGHGWLQPWADKSPHKMLLKGNLASVSFLQTSVHLFFTKLFPERKKKAAESKSFRTHPIRGAQRRAVWPEELSKSECGRRSRETDGQQTRRARWRAWTSVQMPREQLKPWKSQEARSDFREDFLLSYHMNRGWGTWTMSKEKSWKAIWAS